MDTASIYQEQRSFMKYEYLRHDLNTTDPSEQLTILNRLGAQGWELTWVVTSANSPMAVLFFKRDVPR
jgi:hypothetical protein